MPEVNFKANGSDSMALFNIELQLPYYLDREDPSANCNVSARSLGRLGAFMANKGSLGDEKMISEETWDKAHSGEKEMMMNGIQSTTFTAGGFNKYKNQSKQSKECGE